ncbi:MAG: 2Fe-2S iron-sulfur cluster binding domain-containing protein [Gammaproteobacteria bacterium]|nr:2Fe-2S iron-sulfur cluster binding domain-containing protein [Gammaproteobacteria bacterium]
MLKFVQKSGQWVFHRADALFNRFFGEHLNPLFHLGALSYFMYWVVVATGLYVYIFFSTGVNEAYASVEALTHRQWWLGGVMRSMHRYASDAMVLTMLLHLVRHFVFDHYRSFRWFSWVSGVIVLWLVYASGVNGYMLPWDRLAQFVTVTTAEWFDALPVFGGTLIRNFIFEGSVNDRLFSLLTFVHIGLPLFVMLVLWIHTQRVPAARIMPPRTLALYGFTSLVILSLVKPVMSQGGQADLSVAVDLVELDWFYLPVYALLQRWTPADVWYLVGALTLLALLAPWLPPKRSRKDAFHMMIHPDNRIIAIRDGEMVLDAALREDVKIPFDCRSGGCGMCKATLMQGEVEFGLYQKAFLTDAERAQGKVLLCACTPRSDIELEYVPVEAPGKFKARVHAARVVRMNRLSHDVMQVFLKCQGEETPPFYAGQYIDILLPDGDKRSFSFATAPHERELIELQIRLIPGGRFTTHVFNEMKVGDTVSFEGPLGSFFLREDGAKPIIFVAGATGFAPVKSMVEHALKTGLRRKMYLYWGVRSLRDLYLPELPREWERRSDRFKFVPVLSDPAPEDRWEGRTGLVHEAILTDFPDLREHQIYACGSVAMVQAVRPAFMARGMSEHDCFSDAFRITPRMSSESADMVRLGGTA